MSADTSFLCITCGTNTPTETPGVEPARCKICDEPRQYVRAEGQAWIAPSKFFAADTKYTNVFTPSDSDPEHLISITTTPGFGISQRGILVRTPKGNILWDCIAFIDDETVKKVNELGGIKAIVISHPHYYSSMREWSARFGGVPVYTHANDREWVQRPADNQVYWEGKSLSLLDGEIEAVCPGGHFDGSAVLYWNKHLLVGDTMMVAASRKSVSFMYSFPNYWPLPPKDVRAIWDSVRHLNVENIHGAWLGKEIIGNGRRIIFESARAYTEFSGHEAAKYYNDEAAELAF
ncbi:hypothetical protein GQ42DRAFT_163645 [Ramicandelaber brevisporus]|nr:hypothetical protein GQ42DRAFT_163645 [Ramicandelaber brevisporus]